jgi:hypothetical protein
MNHPRSFRAAAALFALGCTHVIHEPANCAPASAPGARSVIGWQRIPGPSSITGHVSSPAFQPIGGALVGLVRLSDPPSRETTAPSSDRGDFSFDSMRHDRYLMRVRRVGYLSASDTLELRPDSGIVATVVLAEHHLTLDECSLTYTERRVPWWKH